MISINHLSPAKKRCNQALLLIGMIVLLLQSSCSFLVDSHEEAIYTNEQNGIKLTYPKSWRITFSERNGLIVITGRESILNSNRVRIEIRTGVCPWNIPIDDFNKIDNYLHEELETLRVLYELDELDAIRFGSQTQIGSFEAKSALISIPLSAFSNTSTRIVTNDRSLSAEQLVEIYAIVSENAIIRAYIFWGDSQLLNEKAVSVISGMELGCHDYKK